MDSICCVCLNLNKIIDKFMKFPLQMESKSVRETRILVQNIWLCMYLASTSCQFLRVSLVKSNTCNSVCACLTLKWVLEREWLTDWMWELERVENTQNRFYICIHWLRGKCEILLIEICSSELDQRISIVVRSFEWVFISIFKGWQVLIMTSSK